MKINEFINKLIEIRNQYGNDIYIEYLNYNKKVNGRYSVTEINYIAYESCNELVKIVEIK